MALSALCILGFATTQPADADIPSYTVIDLGTITNTPAGGGDSFTEARGINNLGQVVGYQAVLRTSVSPYRNFGFRTAPNSPINPATDDIGALASEGPINIPITFANGINKSGQVVGSSFGPNGQGAFRTAPNSPINPATDDLGTLGGNSSSATAINQSGQVVGYSLTANREAHAFRTAPNSPINPVTDDLGTLGGLASYATAKLMNL